MLSTKLQTILGLFVLLIGAANTKIHSNITFRQAPWNDGCLDIPFFNDKPGSPVILYPCVFHDGIIQHNQRFNMLDGVVFNSYRISPMSPSAKPTCIVLLGGLQYNVTTAYCDDQELQANMSFNLIPQLNDSSLVLLQEQSSQKCLQLKYNNGGFDIVADDCLLTFVDQQFMICDSTTRDCI